MAIQKTIGLYVDESGNFEDIADPARYCIVVLVFHNQANDISRQIQELDRANEDLGLDTKAFQFHSSPLIRQEEEYSAMSRRMRGRIFDRMLTFVRHVDFEFCCAHFDTTFANSSEQVILQLERQLSDVISEHRAKFALFDELAVYYDAGQKPIGRLLDGVLSRNVPCAVKFVQGVRQDEHKLLQVADLICTVKRLELKLHCGGKMNLSEERFFGGPRKFRRNICKQISTKEL